MTKKTKHASVDDLDTFIIEWNNICEFSMRIYDKCGFPIPGEEQQLELQDVLDELENAGIVDSLFAEKMEHIISYRKKFSYTEPMDHDELMDMLELCREFIWNHLTNHPKLKV